MISLLAAMTGLLAEEASGTGASDVFAAWDRTDTGDPLLSRVIPALALVLILVGITLWVIKRFFRRGGRAGGSSGLRVVYSLPLGGKRMIQVVRVYGRTLVIGVTGEHVELLTELTEEEINGAPAPGAGDPGVFENILPFRLLRKDRAGKEGVAR